MEIDWSKSKEIIGDVAQLAAVQQNGDALRYFKRAWVDKKLGWDEYFSLVKENEKLWEESVACGELYFKKAEEARKLFMELTNVHPVQD